jgi:hypothetical protein
MGVRRIPSKHEVAFQISHPRHPQARSSLRLSRTRKGPPYAPGYCHFPYLTFCVRTGSDNDRIRRNLRNPAGLLDPVATSPGSDRMPY